MSETAASAPDLRAPAPAAALPVDPALTLALLFFVSGGASLLLETAAVRAFVDLFGSTAASLGAIGGAFLACLALGAAVAGPLADRARRPLRLYALLEAIACGGGLLALQGLRALDTVADAFAKSELAGSPRFALRIAAAVALLIVPVGALGGTLPVLARVRRGLVGRAAAAGVLQAASALGGALGAFLAGAFLLAALGTSGTWTLASALNGAVAIAAFLLARSSGAPPPRPAESRRSDEPLPRALFLHVAAACAGFALLASEVLLFRGLSQLIRGGHDSLGVLLAAFLVGGALGSEAGVLLARDVRRARDGLLLGLLLAAITPLAALLWLRAGGAASDESFLHFGVASLGWGARLANEFVGALLIAGPVAFALALPFPASCELHPGDEGRFGRAVAWLSAAWTAGAALAGIVVPSLLLPQLKLRGALLVCAALPIVALLLLDLFGRGRLLVRRIPWAVAAAAAITGLLVTPVAGGSILSQPLFFYGRVAGATGAFLLDYDEDALANVAVVMRPDGMKLLAVNDQMALGGSGASKVETMEAVIPAMLHPAPKRALLLGVGAGITAAGLRDLGLQEIDAVELLPRVVHDLKLFAAENGAIADDPRFHVHTTDARAFVRAAEPGSYDLIVGDLFFPWEPETGLLYTREHFERVRRLLKPGGIFCQWLPGHQLRWEELGLVGRTFCDVFRGTTVWLARPDFAFPVLALIASSDRLEIDVPALRKRLGDPLQKERLERLGIADPGIFLSQYVGDEWFFRDHFQDKGQNTADRAQVEFQAARRVESDEVVSLFNRRQLFAVHEDVAGKIQRGSMEAKERARLQRELDAASQLTWRLFEAQTLMLFAKANRMLPESQRQNDPVELETQAFNDVAGAMQWRPDHAPTLELLSALFRQAIAAGNYDFVIQGVMVLEGDPAIGVKARLRNLRGMAFLLAVCDPDPGKAAAINHPLDFAVKDFKRAIELDPQLLEAQVSLGITLFLKGGAAESSGPARHDEWSEARVELLSARERIVAPGRPGGHGLPREAEAILLFLGGDVGNAVAILQNGPRSPWSAKILATMATAKP
jgi:spermidine synthase